MYPTTLKVHVQIFYSHTHVSNVSMIYYFSQLSVNSSNELLPPPSPRPSSHNSSTDETILNNVCYADCRSVNQLKSTSKLVMHLFSLQNSDESFTSTTTPGKFPLEDELEMLVQEPTPSPVPSQVILNRVLQLF